MYTYICTSVFVSTVLYKNVSVRSRVKSFRISDKVKETLESGHLNSEVNKLSMDFVKNI